MADGYARASGKPGVALVVPGVGLYNAASRRRGVRLDQRIFTRRADTSRRRPNSTRRNRQEPWGRSRNRRPARRGAFRDQVAAAGVETARGPGCRVRGVQADAHRPPASSPNLACRSYMPAGEWRAPTRRRHSSSSPRRRIFPSLPPVAARAPFRTTIPCRTAPDSALAGRDRR